MAWEQRGHRRYYWRCRRVAGKVKRIYLGRGPDAKLAAALDEERALRRVLNRRTSQADRESWTEACDPLDELIVVTDLLVSTTLLAEGYYRHDRGAWRHRGETRQTSNR